MESARNIKENKAHHKGFGRNYDYVLLKFNVCYVKTY
jgi:hypothetical protein